MVPHAFYLAGISITQNLSPLNSFISLIVVYFQGNLFDFKIPLNLAPFTLIGITLAIFLGFRNNASYDRFWEARKLWGALLIDTRFLVRQAITMSVYPAKSEQVTYFVNLLIAFTYSLKHQLRQTDPTTDLNRLLPLSLANTVAIALYVLLFVAVWFSR